MSATSPSLDYAEVRKADENDKNQFTDSKSDKSEKTQIQFHSANFPIEEVYYLEKSFGKCLIFCTCCCHCRTS